MEHERGSKGGQGAGLATFGILGLLLAVLVAWAPDARAFPATDSCVGCHGIWVGGGGVGHTGHNALGLPQTCNACHVAIGDTPATTRCGSCHVVSGLANHHNNAQAASCIGCHSGTPAPENTPVPGYATITVTLNPCDGSEERFASLTTSLDNDGDLLYDSVDPDCAPRVEICNNGVDDDGDALVDCADQDCTTNPACVGPDVEICSDNLDNDSDGMIDCADTDCALDPACQQPGVEICNNGRDDDGDGLVDCDDPNCATDANCQEPTAEICNDNADNDGDGMIDCADQDCAMVPACQTPIPEDCDDGIDNDGDGFIDCRDPNCCQDPACKLQESCPQFNPPASHTKRETDDGCEAFHAPGYEKPFTNNCTVCHGSALTGPASGGSAPSCLTCHGKEWDENGGGNGNVPADHTDMEDGVGHKPGKDRPFQNGCTSCHGPQLGGGVGPSCFSCHGKEWKEKASGNGGGNGNHYGWDKDKKNKDNKDEKKGKESKSSKYSDDDKKPSKGR